MSTFSNSKKGKTYRVDGGDGVGLLVVQAREHRVHQLLELHVARAPCPHRGARDLLCPARPQQGQHLRAETNNKRKKGNRDAGFIR